jgi:hypothetical protein
METITDSSGNRHDIFERSTEFDPKHIGVGIDTKGRSAQELLDHLCHGMTGGCDYRRGRGALAHFTGKRRTGQDGNMQTWPGGEGYLQYL